MNTWERLTQVVSERLPRQSFEKWFESAKLFAENDRELTVAVPNKFTKEWIENNYLDVLKEALSGLDCDKLLSFTVEYHPSDQDTPELAAPKATPPSDAAPSTLHERDAYLNPRFSFENFVVGPSNQFAHAAARAVAEVLYTAYNPLFIYGGVGLGKTHLMHAIGQHVRSDNPNIRICFVSSEHFMNEMISCIRYDRMPQFRQKYRNMDVLMVDDIQFLSDKERTQEEFFHTFNALYDARKQLVFSSDRYPKEIQNLEERLRSRFEWGLLADIHPPDLETKVAILRKKAAIDGIHLPNDVSLFLAKKIRSNVRELEGSLIKLGAVASLTGRQITVDLAKEVLKDIFYEREQIVSIDRIQKQVAAYYKIRTADMKSKKRNQSIVQPRQTAMFLCRKLTDKSLPEIGRSFGGKDHTTVLHACRNIEERMKSDQDLSNTITKLAGNIQSL